MVMCSYMKHAVRCCPTIWSVAACSTHIYYPVSPGKKKTALAQGGAVTLPRRHRVARCGCACLVHQG